MRDPVNGFDYPEAWVKKCSSPDLLPLVENGLAVLTSSGTVIRRGFTTGTTAAAVCKAAILSLAGEVSSVPVDLPCGLTVAVAVSASGGIATAKKFAGDYPDDVTAGCEFIAEASRQPSGVRFVPGAGIGRFSRDTPRFRKGEPAISPAPLDCIFRSIQDAMDMTGYPGIQVTLWIPRGAEIAKKTLNSQVGIEGGISVLGTTGFVEPWDDHLEESIRERLSSSCNALLTTGRIGLRYARIMYPDFETVLVGGKIGEALDAARGDVILFGLPALILRYINPDILEGTGFVTIEEYSESPGFHNVVMENLNRFRKEYPQIRVILINRDGKIIGESP
jgi:cobalt-precorrin-5B (C1)-methyltransferase